MSTKKAPPSAGLIVAGLVALAVVAHSAATIVVQLSWLAITAMVAGVAVYAMRLQATPPTTPTDDVERVVERVIERHYIVDGGPRHELTSVREVPQVLDAAQQAVRRRELGG